MEISLHEPFVEDSDEYCLILKRELIAGESALQECKQKLIQAQKTETIEQRVAGIAHDFNNILTTIMLKNEAILYYEPEGSFSKKYAEQIKVSIEKASVLARQLLAFSNN